MTDEEVRRRALAAAAQATDAAAELIRFVQEGPRGASTAFDAETVEQLCDAAKMAIEVAREVDRPDEERDQVHAALYKFLEGWVG
jgi:hypothetical protein